MQGVQPQTHLAPSSPRVPPHGEGGPPPARRPHGGLVLGLLGRGRGRGRGLGGRGSSWGCASVCRRPLTLTRTLAASWPPRAWGALAVRRGPCGLAARAPPRPLGARCRCGAARSGLLVRVRARAIGLGVTRARGALGWVSARKTATRHVLSVPPEAVPGACAPLSAGRVRHVPLPLPEQPGSARAGLGRARAWGAVAVRCGACRFVARAPPPPCSARAHAAAEGGGLAAPEKKQRG